MVKCLPTVRETQVWSLGQEDPLEKEIATHSCILVWKIPWMEEPGQLQSMESQRIRHDWATNTFILNIFVQLLLNQIKEIYKEEIYKIVTESKDNFKTILLYSLLKGSSVAQSGKKKKSGVHAHRINTMCGWVYRKVTVCTPRRGSQKKPNTWTPWSCTSSLLNWEE